MDLCQRTSQVNLFRILHLIFQSYLFTITPVTPLFQFSFFTFSLFSLSFCCVSVYFRGFPWKTASSAETPHPRGPAASRKSRVASLSQCSSLFRWNDGNLRIIWRDPEKLSNLHSFRQLPQYLVRSRLLAFSSRLTKNITITSQFLTPRRETIGLLKCHSKLSQSSRQRRDSKECLWIWQPGACLEGHAIILKQFIPAELSRGWQFKTLSRDLIVVLLILWSNVVVFLIFLTLLLVSLINNK